MILCWRIVARNKLEQHDIDLLSQIGFQPLAHSQRAWPKFRSYRLGHSWFLEQAEGNCCCQTCGWPSPLCGLSRERRICMTTVRTTKCLFALKMQQTPCRSKTLTGKTGASSRTFAGLFHCLHLNWPDFTRCLKMPGFLWNWIVYIPRGVDEEPRPHFLWMGVAVDAHKGVLLDSAMDNSQTQKPEQVAARCLLQTMTKLKCRPKEILMSRTGLAFALEPITHPLGIRTSHLAKLKEIDRIYRRLIRSMDLDRC